MILKKLTATGFKSFADKTEFEFNRGITCIVGPNGCGKSNVVDAIKWVLGEQSAKSLRGTQMLDVIFNGSGTRKPGGMAQVDLTFDNSDGTLAVDQTEVVVSRRLYRSGESEYLINKQISRLKDVRELFLDTGVGVDAYSVIEQGRVDVLLQANPTERRLIFEEAAGISKYKLRKKEALRRLERVNQNLLRVQDIVEEVEKRLRSVKLAAGKARNYQTYMQQLRELRSRYALSEYHRLRTTQDELTRETNDLSDLVTKIRTDLSNLDAKTSQSNVRIADLEREISQAESRLLTVQSQIAGHQERIEQSNRRVADQQNLLERSKERLAGFDDQMASLDGRLSEQQKNAETIEAELQLAEQEQSHYQEEDRGCAHELNDSKSQLETAKTTAIDSARQAGRLQNEIQGFTIHQQTLAKERGRLSEREAIVVRDLEEATSRRQSLATKQGEIDALIQDKKRTLDETTTRIGEAAQQRAALLDQLAAAKEFRSGLESRRQLLEEMDRKHEGLLAGAREILEQRDADSSGQKFNYVLGAVGELFETDVSHAKIVEAVLGDVEKYLVVSQRDHLLADQESLGELSGRVQAFCLDQVPPAIGGPDLSGQEGFVANLLDWVRYPEVLGKLARLLLGRTYVIENIEHAQKIAALIPAAGRFVSLAGVVFEADGRVSVGTLGADTGMISRRSELRELERELTEVTARIDSLSERQRQTESEVSHLEAVQEELRKAVFAASTQRVETQAAINSVEEQLRKLSAEQPIIASEMAMIDKRLTDLQAQEATARETMTTVEARGRDSEAIVQQSQARIEELSQRRSTISEKITASRVRIGELMQRRASVAEQMRDLQAAKIQLQSDRDKAQHDVVEAQERIEQSQRLIAEAQATLEALSTENTELQHRSMTLRQERDGLREAVDQFSRDSRRLRNDLEKVEAELHERQIKLQEIRVRCEDLVGRIAEELSVDLAAQYETYQPDSQEDWPAVEAEINDLRAKIERLGNVNLDAITEQEELETRQKFLSDQLADLRSSETQLQTLIDKLNEESQQRFLDTFNAVHDHFAALFKKLFGGGKAELTLLDPNDVLECGIEIMARPPGKEPQSISLLSGGEKTMTAIALLMAVFRSRPSPFVLLDEVDAALDEANNSRFNHVVQEFVSLSQFIVITHSKRTMSMADVMYGVTMQEAGVSKRVSVKFEDDNSRETAVA